MLKIDLVAPPAPAPDGGRDLSPIEMAAMLGRCRGYALNCGALAVLCATAESEAELGALTTEFHHFRAAFVDLIDAHDGILKHLRQWPDLDEHLHQCLSFHRMLTQLPEDRLDFTRDAAKEVARLSRQEVLPAFYAIIARLEREQDEQRQARLERIQEKAELVDGMLGELSRIGRMISIIAINASIEAARAGGEPGRAFKVIAEEVQDLSRQSSSLLEETKARLADQSADETAPYMTRQMSDAHAIVP